MVHRHLRCTAAVCTSSVGTTQQQQQVLVCGTTIHIHVSTATDVLVRTCSICGGPREVIRTHRKHKNLYMHVFLLGMFGSDYYSPVARTVAVCSYIVLSRLCHTWYQVRTYVVLLILLLLFLSVGAVWSLEGRFSPSLPETKRGPASLSIRKHPGSAVLQPPHAPGTMYRSRTGCRLERASPLQLSLQSRPTFGQPICPMFECCRVERHRSRGI